MKTGIGIIVLLAIIYFATDKKVKGNVNSNGNKIYYEKGHRLYSVTNAEEMFRSVKAAERAGYRAPRR